MYQYHIFNRNNDDDDNDKLSRLGQGLVCKNYCPETKTKIINTEINEQTIIKSNRQLKAI